MKIIHLWHRRILSAVLLAWIGAALAGCGGGLSSLIEEKDYRKQFGPPPPPLQTTAPFFDGNVEVLAALAVRPDLLPRPERREAQSASGSTVVSAEDPYGMSVPSEVRNRRRPEIHIAPVLLYLNFTNKGAEPLRLEIVEVKSILGNFAPDPSVLTLQPGETREILPMISRLGIQPTELDLSLTLRVGEERERREIRLMPKEGAEASTSG